MEDNVTAMTEEQLKRVLTAVITATNKWSPLEEKALKKEQERERRQQKLGISLGYAEEMKRWVDQHSCTHSRNEKTGEAVARGTGVWCTGGQFNTNYNQIQLICTRCATQWIFLATPQEREHLLNGGELRGCAPPPLERCLNKDTFITRKPEDPTGRLAELDAAWEREHA